MRNRIILAALLIVSPFCVGLSFNAQPRAEWEFKAIPSSDKYVPKEVIAAGIEGWEIVAVKDTISDGRSFGCTFYLKRQK